MTKMDLERRAAIELRASGRKLVGHAAVFDQQADIGTFKEVIRRGAFSNTLAKGNDVVALVDHAPGQLLGRTKAGTLRLAEDTKGLAFEIDVPATTLGNDLLALAERGDLGGASFGFLVPKNGERWSGQVRELITIDLREVSIVSAWPAYTSTDVAVRAHLNNEVVRLTLARLRVDMM